MNDESAGQHSQGLHLLLTSTYVSNPSSPYITTLVKAKKLEEQKRSSFLLLQSSSDARTLQISIYRYDIDTLLSTS